MKKLKLASMVLALTCVASMSAMAQRDWDRDHDRDRGRAVAGNAYNEGYRAGQIDASRGGRRNMRSDRWGGRDRGEFESGYNRGFEDAMRANRQGAYGGGVYRGQGGPYGGGVYGGQQNMNWAAQARQIGMQDGVNDGANDRRT